MKQTGAILLTLGPILAGAWFYFWPDANIAEVLLWVTLGYYVVLPVSILMFLGGNLLLLTAIMRDKPKH